MPGYATLAKNEKGEFEIKNRHTKESGALRVAKRSTKAAPLWAAEIAEDGSVARLLSRERGGDLQGNENPPEAKQTEIQADPMPEGAPKITVTFSDARKRLEGLADRFEGIAKRLRDIAVVEKEIREVTSELMQSFPAPRTASAA